MHHLLLIKNDLFSIQQTAMGDHQTLQQTAVHQKGHARKMKATAMSMTIVREALFVGLITVIKICSMIGNTPIAALNLKVIAILNIVSGPRL